MIRIAPVLLLAIAMLLGGVLYLQSRVGMPEPVGADVPPRGRSVAIPAVRQPAPSDHATARVTTILARPLFSPTRRPFETVAKARDTGAPMPRLTGVLVSEAGAGAIFAGAGEKPILAHAGDRVGPYLVRSISAGQVVVDGPSGLVTLHPVFASQPSGPPPVSATPHAPSLLERLRAGGRQPAALPSPSLVQRLIEKQQAGTAK